MPTDNNSAAFQSLEYWEPQMSLLLKNLSILWCNLVKASINCLHFIFDLWHTSKYILRGLRAACNREKPKIGIQERKHGPFLLFSIFATLNFETQVM